METKQQVYNRCLSAIDEMPLSLVQSASSEIEQRVLTMNEFRTALRVGLYAPWGKAVRTDTLFSEGDKHRKEMYYPVADAEAGAFVFYRVSHIEDLKPTGSGGFEPGLKRSRLRDLNMLNVLIVPGVAFDLGGSRLGFGEGMYEKCLTAYRGTRIALAYDLQVVGRLPHAVHGKKVDWIVTEKRLIKC